MFLFFKPQLGDGGGGGFDGGGISDAYVIRTDKKNEPKKKQPKKKLTAKKPSLAGVKPTAASVVQYVEDNRLDELRDQLSALSTEVELEMLKAAEALAVAQLQQEAARQYEDAKRAEEEERERYALELLSKMIEEAERELAAEHAEVLEILDMLDDDAMRALEVHSYTSRKKRKRPFSKS